VEAVPLVHQLESVRVDQARRPAELPEALDLDLRNRSAIELVYGARQHGDFGGLYVFFCLVLGLTLAILLDQKIRAEGVLRPIYLYPLALSFIVTGTAWKLFLDPGIGLEKAVHVWGWTSFKFDWVVNPE
jgi:hypothetical protein